MKHKLTVIISWIIPFSIMALIFYFSSQTSADSTQVSRSLGGTVLRIIQKILSVFGMRAKNFPNAEDIDFFIRKAAHFIIYTALGASVYHAFRISRLSSRLSLLFAPLWCLVYSVTDEFHQFFTDGRSAQITDIVLDTLGGIAGTLLVGLLWNGHTKRKQRSAASGDVPQ